MVVLVDLSLVVRDGSTTVPEAPQAGQDALSKSEDGGAHHPSHSPVQAARSFPRNAGLPGPLSNFRKGRGDMIHHLRDPCHVSKVCLLLLSLLLVIIS